MIVASIDIGTNSTRLLIAQSSGGVLTDELFRQTIITRLGQDVSSTSRLSEAAIDRTLNVLKDYHRLTSEHGVEALKAVATSAVREADNSADLMTRAGSILKIMPEIISGDIEASLTYDGALSDAQTRALGPGFLVIDIGGGSTEIIRGDQKGPESIKSVPLGCVRLSESFFNLDPPSADEISDIRRHIRELLKDEFPGNLGRGFVPLAVAGTASSLVAIELGLIAYDPKKVHRYRLGRQSINSHLKKLASIPLDKRKKVIGLEPERADVIVAGAAILLEIMIYFDFDAVFASEHDILDGLALATARSV